MFFNHELHIQSNYQLSMITELRYFQMHGLKKNFISHVSFSRKLPEDKFYQKEQGNKKKFLKMKRQDPAQRIQHGRDKENFNNPLTPQKMESLQPQNTLSYPSLFILSNQSQSSIRKQISIYSITFCMLFSAAPVVYHGFFSWN